MNPAGDRRRDTHPTWPRCYVQDPLGQVFELCRGSEADGSRLIDCISPTLTRGWRCWIEHALLDVTRVGGVAPRRLSPAE